MSAPIPVPIYTRFSSYSPSDFGPGDVDIRTTFFLQMEDARNYFLRYIKPRLDRSYKLYIAYNRDLSEQLND